TDRLAWRKPRQGPRGIGPVGHGARRFAPEITDRTGSWLATIISVAAVNVVITRAIGVIGTRQEDRVPDKKVAIRPERVVIAVRPEHEREKVAEEIEPEDRSKPHDP